MYVYTMYSILFKTQPTTQTLFSKLHISNSSFILYSIKNINWGLSYIKLNFQLSSLRNIHIPTMKQIKEDAIILETTLTLKA
jgi:hypothetical protein